MSGVAEQASKKVFHFFRKQKGEISFMSKVLHVNDTKLNVVPFQLPNGSLELN